MTREEIMKMAREAKMPYYYRTGEIDNIEAVERFARSVAEYERELAQLRKATTPASSQPSGPAKTKAFHELSLDEQERELMRMAGEVDRNG